MNLLHLVVLFISSVILFNHEANALPSKPGTRILGGTSAKYGQFPSVVAIFVQTSDSTFFCGGALIDPQWILTSGHCVYDGVRFNVQLGANTLRTYDPDRVNVTTSEYVLHPDFNPDTIDNAVGLIKLPAPVTLTEFIIPITLPRVGLRDGTNVTAVGWGEVSDYYAELSNVLKYVIVPTLSNAACRLVYGTQITDTMVCVGGNYNQGTCTGDNGSPLIESSDGDLSIVGVATFISGNGCASIDPSGFTRVFPYIDWIISIIYNDV